MTLILLNGPPRSGKDTVANMLCSMLPETSHWKLSGELKARTHAVYGVDRRDPEEFERTKDQPSLLFLGLSPRQAYIEMHERYLKPVHGPRILGELLLKNIMRSFPLEETENIVVSDAGDVEQCMPLVEAWRPKNTILVHLNREGCTWDNRVRFTLSGVRTVTLENSCDLPTLRSKLQAMFVLESPFHSGASPA